MISGFALFAWWLGTSVLLSALALTAVRLGSYVLDRQTD
jgi:hypothetical protein